MIYKKIKSDKILFLKGKAMSLSIKFYVTFKDKNQEEQQWMFGQTVVIIKK